MEEWKNIEGYEGLYQVSSLGRVKTLARNCYFTNRWGQAATRTIDEMIMKTKIQNNGYEVVTLSKNGVRQSISVHRLVAMAFIPNPENKPQVDHINGDKTLNIMSNLRWVSAAENAANPLWVEHSRNISDETRRKMSQKAYHSHDKPIIQYDLDGEMVGKFDSAAVASRFYGFSKGHICSALKTEGKIAYDSIWKYKEKGGA